MWSFRLRGPKGKAAVLEIDPEENVHRFCELAIQQLGLKRNSKLTFRSGFPPRPVEYNLTDVVKNVFANNDTVVVDIASQASSTSATANPVSQSVCASSVKKPLARNGAKKEPKKAQGIHTLHGSTKSTRSTKTAAPSKRKFTGKEFKLGSSLNDPPVAQTEVQEQSEGMGSPGNQSQRKYRRIRNIHLTSKEDVELSLVNAVNGGSNDRAAKFFRGATKSAVEYQYQTTLANARLNAALSNKFEIQEINTTQRLNNDSPVEMKVRFKEGVRKWKEETVTLLQAVELQAILKYVLLSGGETGREMLKPFNMAQCSPRVFWSIARLYGGNVAAGLADLVPDVEWSFLDVRTRTMSEKAKAAKANEEYWKLWKKSGGSLTQEPKKTKKTNDAELEAKKSEIMEIDSDRTATEEEFGADNVNDIATKNIPTESVALSKEQGTPNLLRQAMARAAQARFDIRARTAEVVAAFQQPTIVQPVNNDREVDEDVEETTTIYCDACNKARILSTQEATIVGVGDDRWTCANLARINREGVCQTVDDEIEQIAGKTIGALLQQAAIFTRKDLANATINHTLRQLISPDEFASTPLKTKLESMIDEARLDEVNDMMQEIVGDADLVGQLELQKLGTPADLLTTPTDLIFKAATESMINHDFKMERIQEWQEKAKALVEQYEWLGEWRTI